MTRHITAKIILVLTFVLSACGANVEPIHPTSTLIPTLTSTATTTFTPSLTETLTPISTATPFTCTSCVDPKAIAEQDAGFTARTGIDLSNPAANPESQKFADFVKKHSSIGYDPKTPEIRTIQFVKIGFGMASAKEMTGGKIDKIVCLYGRNNVVPGETFSIAVGWIDLQGTYHALAYGGDQVTGQDLSKPWQFRKGISPKPSEQLRMIQAIEDGAQMQFDIHTFDQAKSIDQIQSEENAYPPVNRRAVQEFIRKLGNQTLERLGIDHSITAYWDNVDPQKGDTGFIPAGNWIYYDLFDASK